MAFTFAPPGAYREADRRSGASRTDYVNCCEYPTDVLRKHLADRAEREYTGRHIPEDLSNCRTAARKIGYFFFEFIGGNYYRAWITASFRVAQVTPSGERSQDKEMFEIQVCRIPVTGKAMTGEVAAEFAAHVALIFRGKVVRNIVDDGDDRGTTEEAPEDSNLREAEGLITETVFLEPQCILHNRIQPDGVRIRWIFGGHRMHGNAYSTAIRIW